MDKASIRASALQQRRSLSIEQRSNFSHAIISSLFDYLSGRLEVPASLLIYRSMPSEVATDELLQSEDYRLYAPVTHHHEHMEWHQVSKESDWHTGLFGILEPDDGALWDASSGPATLICPLTAFDREGNRLGMGKGCFDFWLAQHHHKIQQIIGLAFSCQEVTQLPAERHDMPMNCIITEKEVIQCPKR